MKKLLRIFVLLVMSFSLSGCSQQLKSSKIEDYDKYLAKVEYAKDYMPSVENCGEYSSVLATYKCTVFLFETYTVGLFLSYDQEEYQKQREEIALEYVFFTPDDEALQSDCDAAVKGYNIRLVKQEYMLTTEKMGLLIGFDDAKQKICYLYYYDFDLDVLDNLDGYVRQYFEMA